MAKPTPGSTDRPAEPAGMSPAEQLACEWEARHDVAARGRQIDPAAALQRYLGHARCEDLSHHEHTHHEHPHHEHRHRDHAHGDHAHGDHAEHAARRHGAQSDRLAAEHPLTASWLRWGEDPH